MEVDVTRVGLAFLTVLLTASAAFGGISIDAEAGIIKGPDTGLSFDVKAGILYDSQAVLQSKISFKDVLSDCEPVPGGQVCINPISGTYGLLDEDGFYICEDFFVSEKDSYYEPGSGKWLPSDLGPLVGQSVQLAEAEAERRMFSGWKLHRGPIEPLAFRLAAEKPSVSLWRIFQPTMGISGISRPEPIGGHNTYTASLPKNLSAYGLKARLEKHCNVPAFYPFDGASGFEYEEELRTFLTTKLDKRQQVADRMNAALAREGKGRQLNWKRSTLEAGWLNLVDKLENWHVLYQENGGAISAVAVINFRSVGTATQMDWLVASLRVATPVDVNGDPGHSFASRAHSNYSSLTNLYRLAYSKACVGGGQ